MKQLLKPEFFYSGAVFFVSLLLYTFTLAPTVTLVDSGELIVAAHFLGVPHPPGFPLYMVLTHLASLVPIGNIAQRIHFASALFAALAAALITLVIAEFFKTRVCVEGQRKLKKKRGAQTKRLPPAVNSSFITLLPAFAAGLLMAFSRTLWSYATIAEVYTLNALLIAVIFWLMINWRRRIMDTDRRTASKRPPIIRDHDWLLYLAAGVFGLALGVHHVTVALMLPALALLVWTTQGPQFFVSRRFLYAAVLSFAALIAVYSYLPISASRAPIINWGDPHSLQAIWAHITGKQYQVFLSFDAKVAGNQLIEFGKLLLREFGPWWFPVALGLAIVGFADLLKRDRATFWFLALIVISDVAYGVSYFIAEDKDAYYLPAFIALAIASAFGLRTLLSLRFVKRESPIALSLVTAVLILLAPGAALASNWPFDNRRHYFIAHDYVENILGSMERGGLLLTLDWQVASPMLYAREIEHLRPDVKVVDINLLRRLWYFDYLNRAYPDLIERSHDKVNSFVAELRQWNNDPKSYANDTNLTQRIASKFQNMIVSFVTKENEVAPAYVTNDILFQTEPEEKELAQWLSKQYQLVPHGLIFKLEKDRGFRDPGPLSLQTRGLADGTVKFEPDDVVSLKLLPVYKTMLVNRGRYFSFFNQPERAIESFTNALALDPKLELAREGLSESLEKMRKPNGSSP